MSVFADFIDLRTAVIEQIGNADIADVFPRLVKMAEVDFNRRLRCRDMMTDASLAVANGTGALPSDFAEAIGLFEASGAELIGWPSQAYQALTSKAGSYSIIGGNIHASDGSYSLHYYAEIPTLTASITTSNWLLAKYPELYLYAVAEKAAKHLADVGLATATGSLAETEYQSVHAQDHAERYSRTRVRVKGPTP